MSEKKIIQFDSASQVNSDAYVPITQLVNGNQKTLKALIDQLGAYISRVQQYNDLDTTAKDLIGAINEAAQSGSIEMEQTATTPVSIASISDGGDNIPVKSLKVLVSAVQSGSGTPSPSNIRSISGWSECNLSATGKNILDKSLLLDQVSWNVITLQLNPNTKYTMSSNVTSSKATDELPAYFFNSSGNPSASTLVSASQAVTITTNADGIAKIQQRRITGSDSFQAYDWQIEEGSSSTTIEPFGTTHTIPFGQTVYGGLLDVTKGVLTITHGYKSYSGGFSQASNGIFYIDGTISDADTSGYSIVCLSNRYDYAGVKTATSGMVGEEGKFGVQFLQGLRIMVCDTSFADDTAFNNSLSSTPLQIVYPLATPTTIYLTPTQVKTLLTCNIFADTGDIDTLIYFNSNADETADVVEAYVGNVVNLYATLATGNTSVTISSSAIHTNSTIDIYTDNDVDYISAVVTEGQIVVNFDAQASDLGVKVRVS